MNGKLRWQIIQLTDSSKEDTPTKGKKDPAASLPQKSGTDRAKKGEELPAEEGEELPSKEGEELPSKEGNGEGMEEVVYRRGVYLGPGATLRDLRNGFVDTHQTASEHRMFLFLRSDILGDQYDISSETGTHLTNIRGSLVQPQTMYIESLARSAFGLLLVTFRGQKGYFWWGLCLSACTKMFFQSNLKECYIAFRDLFLPLLINYSSSMD